jgi:2-polyprenyl-3-methyl-5-hydroxy-6-metoxy-1,4-benzoquinol methylase
MPESTAPSRAYVMTHSDTERRRLALQASIINPFTDRFLRDAGIAGGMHVLDFGCGVGDVSLMAGRLVGGHGTVTGVDIDPEALAIATARAKEEGLDHVRFVQSDLSAFAVDKRYDAITARHILIHTPDPVGLIRRATSFVHPGFTRPTLWVSSGGQPASSTLAASLRSRNSISHSPFRNSMMCLSGRHAATQ